MSIRPALAADEAAVRACVRDAYGRYIGRMAAPPAPMLDDYTTLIARGVVDIATEGQQLVGVLVMWPEVDHLYIDNVAVLPSAQGSGVDMGYQRVYLTRRLPP